MQHGIIFHAEEKPEDWSNPYVS